MAEYSKAIGIAQFRDYVKSLPHQWIFDHLISGGTRRILSSAMVSEAAVKFTAKAALVKRFKGLTPKLRLRCAQVYLMGANGLSLPETTVHAREPLLPSLLVLAAAQSGGWTGGTDGVRLFGFDEFEPSLRPLMAEALAETGTATAPESAAVCPWRPLNDIAAVCSLALHRQLSRSAHGGLSRSATAALKRLVHDPTLTGKGISEKLPGHPSGFLIGFCLKESLIVDAEEEYTLNRQVFTIWLELSMKERMRRLAVYADEFLGGFNLELAYELLKCADGRWLSINQLIPEIAGTVFTRALGVLEFLGRVQTSQGSAAASIRFTPCKFIDGDIDKLYAKEQRRDTLVMPDFSVIIPQEISPSELYDFSKVGLLSEFDKVYKGRITKETISNALSVGTDPSYLREWLRARNASTNVAKTVDEWIREFSRLFVCGGPLLVTSDEKVARQIASIEPLRKHIIEMNAHAVFRIKPGSERKALDILEKLGFDTRTPFELEDADFIRSDRQQDIDNEDEPAEMSTVENLWVPLIDFSAASNTQPRAQMSRTKYGAGLKTLEINDMIHVADYAILTNQSLVLDYAGSSNMKLGIYTVVPTGIDKGVDAAVEAELPGIRGRQLFFLAKTKRIGVIAQ
ncbi:MAG: hypothetical protein LBU70_07435 [Chitinispirillales bacterium]|jgi:hypothetical protein|nr:hypothetical protein [Chitinispirillales bacterium]